MPRVSQEATHESLFALAPLEQEVLNVFLGRRMGRWDELDQRVAMILASSVCDSKTHLGNNNNKGSAEDLHKRALQDTSLKAQALEGKV